MPVLPVPAPLPPAPPGPPAAVPPTAGAGFGISAGTTVAAQRAVLRSGCRAGACRRGVTTCPAATAVAGSRTARYSAFGVRSWIFQSWP